MYAPPNRFGWVVEKRMSGTGRDGLLIEPTRTVGRAHQWPRHDAGKADLLGLLAQLDELLRLYPAGPWGGLWGRAQVLGDRDQLAARVVKILQRLADLGALLAHAEDQIGLRHQPVGARRPDHV